MMNRKNLLMLSILSTAVVLSACGSDTGDVSVENTETEIVASVDIETETTEETTETEEIESTEITDTEVEATETVDTENETETEAVASGGAATTYEDTLPADQAVGDASALSSIIAEYGSIKNWGNIARENGADGVCNYYWYYENGSAAGDKPSYLVYMREGSSYYGQVFQYGDTLLDGTINMNGTNDEYTAWLGEQVVEAARDQGYEVEVNEDGTFNIIAD
jgi:hypothetical protein